MHRHHLTRPIRAGDLLVAVLLAAVIAVTGLGPLGADPQPADAAGLNGRVAFASNKDGDIDIYSVKKDGSDRRNLTAASAAKDTHPAWSPDGKSIAFASDRDGDLEIFVMQADGSGVRQLTYQPGVDARPTWSPDGTELAFRSDRSGSPQIHVLSLLPAPIPVQKLTGGPGANTEPSWGANDRIAFTSNRGGDREIFVMSGDGTNEQQVTTNGADDGSPRWVSATRLLFQSKVGGDFEIVEINVDRSNRVAITDNVTDQVTPVRSPDGQLLMYTTPPTGGGRAIFVTGSGDGPGSYLVNDGAVNEFPDWQGQRLVLRPLEQRVSQVSMEVFGTKTAVHFTTRWATDEARVELWKNGTFRWKFDQGAPVTRHHLTVSDLDPGSIYTVRIVTPRRLTSGDVTYQWPAQVKTLIRRVTLTYTSAYVHNDGDAGSCGDIKLFIDIDDQSYSNTHPWTEACGGWWDVPDQTVVRDPQPDDDMIVKFLASEEDDVGCGLVDDCSDIARGQDSFTLVNDSESFTAPGSVHLHPQGDSLNLVVHFTYSVSYHP